MSGKRKRESMERMDKVYRIVQQSSTNGINAAEIGKKLGIHRSTVHRNLVSLELMGKVENTGGMWRAKTGEQTIKPLEKEIVIELPIPKNQWRRMAQLEIYANCIEGFGMLKAAGIPRTIIEKFNETRTIRIRGKNVDDLELEKIGNLIQQATEKSSKFNLRGLFKGLKRDIKNLPEKPTQRAASEKPEQD
jgi:predicted transcriptional regulator